MDGVPSAGKAVAVVGCTRGIGRALTEWFAAHGHRVAGCGTNSEELDKLKAAWPEADLRAVDVRDEAAVCEWLEAAAAQGPVDLLVCCAGVLPAPAPFWEQPESALRAALDVNVLGTAAVLRHAVPKLRAPGGTAVLVSSRYGRAVAQGRGAYSATKWATEAMAKTLALELQDQGVAVVSFDPGLVNTEMLRASCPGREDWCSQQRTPSDFAAEAGPFLLSISIADTGRSLTCPGSPPDYFQTGVVCSGRPAWANGLGPFVRAIDEAGEDAAKPTTGLPAPAPGELANGSPEGTSAVAATPSRRYFISGVMLGSQRKLDDAQQDLAPQDYRTRMAHAIVAADPSAVVVDPLHLVQQRAAEAGLSLEGLSLDDRLVDSVFREVIDLASRCDVVISYLPQASMGSALELWEAQRAGRRVFTVSPMAANWTIRAVSEHNFSDLDDLEQNLAANL